MQYIAERCLITEICRRLYEKDLIRGPEGNVSVRVDADRILATPSGQCKGFVSAGELVLVDLEGQVLEGHRPPSSELPMHLALYRARADVRAVVHAHPPAVLAYSLSRQPLPEKLLPETVLLLGQIARVPPHLPGSDALAQAVAEALRAPQSTALLENHGAVTVGHSLEEAWQRMEVFEAACRAAWMATQLGPLHPLPKPILEALRPQGEGP